MMAADLSVNSVGVVTPQMAQFTAPFQFSNGTTLDQHTLVYETYGELNAAGTNAVLICHALSGSHHAAGFHSTAEKRPGWWDLAIGPGKPIDTNRLFVVCSNNLGGCDGSTGPSSPMPGSDVPWGSQFPQPQVRDWVRSQKLLAEYLGISRWAAVIGGSLGGMQALQWAVDYPDWVEHCVALASAPGLTAQNIAFNEIARHAILSDPEFKGGDYLAEDTLPARGVALASDHGIAEAEIKSQLPDAKGSSMPCQPKLVDPLRPEWPIWQHIFASVSWCTKSVSFFQAVSCSGRYRPGQPGVMRPVSDTQVISV